MMNAILWLRDHWSVPMLIVFLLILFANYAPGRGAQIQKNAQIPLRDEFPLRDDR
jgi:cbb3-type cytochrome oxidase subunit 3